MPSWKREDVDARREAITELLGIHNVKTVEEMVFRLEVERRIEATIRQVREDFRALGAVKDHFFRGDARKRDYGCKCYKIGLAEKDVETGLYVLVTVKTDSTVPIRLPRKSTLR